MDTVHTCQGGKFSTRECPVTPETIMTLSCTYDPADNRLRLSSLHRLDPDTYARVKAAGFKWAPKQELFIAPMWTPAREDLLIELCGTIDDEDSTLVERAEARAERFEDYHDKREAEAAATHAAVATIMDGIPLGQKILIGHHSEKHARKDAERIESGIRKAVSLWETAQYWQDRARGALRHAKYKERPDVRARRIKGLEADLRKQQRAIADAEKFTAAWRVEPCTLQRAKAISNYDHISQCFPLADYPREPPASQYQGDMGLWSALDGRVITAEQARELALPAHAHTMAHAQRWVTHLTHRIAYERALLENAGGTVAGQAKPEKGGACKCWVGGHGEWRTIMKVNKVSVTVLDNRDNGGSNFSRVVPFDKLTDLMSVSDLTARRDAGLIRDNRHGTGFFVLESPTPAEPAGTAGFASPEAKVQWLAGANGCSDIGISGFVKWEKSVLPTLTPDIITNLKATLHAGVQIAVVDQLFPTPPALAARMVALADIQRGHRILEPSAGTGNILAAIRCRKHRVEAPCHAVAIEKDPRLVQAGGLDALANEVRCADFLTLTPATLGTFDVIVMNPPFAHGQDIAHVTHALQFLKPGGRLVAIMSTGITFNSDAAHVAFRALLERHDATAESLPADTFKDSGTSVNTVLVVVRLPHPAAAPPTLATLACTITQAEAVAAATLHKTRFEAETRGRLRPHRCQSEPIVLFSKSQGELF